MERQKEKRKRNPSADLWHYLGLNSAQRGKALLPGPFLLGNSRFYFLSTTNQEGNKKGSQGTNHVLFHMGVQMGGANSIHFIINSM